MKTIKLISLVMPLMLASGLWASEPPSTLNVHYRDGHVTAVAFTEFIRIDLSSDSMTFVGRNVPAAASLADICKLTFGQSDATLSLPVTFRLVGEESGGEIYASVLEDGRAFNSGEKLKAGLNVRFLAVPHAGYGVKGWRVNGIYEASGATERTCLLSRKYVNGLHVEVEFMKQTEDMPEIRVTFATAGDGTGKLSAFVLENGIPTQEVNSGDKVEAGHTVLFKAEPNSGCKIHRWRINGDSVSGVAGNRAGLLTEDRYADGLQVEVTFMKEAGVEEAGAFCSTVDVYVQGREIGIRSTSGIERVELLDINGCLLRTVTPAGRPNQLVVPVGSVTPGIYVLRVRTTEREETGKVIIR